MSEAREERNDPPNPIAAVTHPDPYPYYRRLAVERPLYRDESLGLWVAASAAAVTAVLTGDLCRVRPDSEPVPKALVGTAAGEVFSQLVRMTDGEGYPPLKRAVTAALGSLDGRSAFAAAREQARAMARDLDLPHDPTRLDELILRLPVQVVSSLLGVEEDRLAAAAGWGIDVASSFAPGAAGDRIERGAKAAAELRDLLTPSAPGHSCPHSQRLLKTLTDESERSGCPAGSAVANGIGFLFQACETTAGLIGATLLALAGHREIRERVDADPGCLEAVIAEVLRCDPPVQSTRRFVARDGILSGCDMRSGDSILVVLAAANRDPAASPDPDRFDPWRPERTVFSFGSGEHACPGQTLAATMARGAVHELLAAGLALELLTAVSYRPSGNIRVPLFGAG